MNDAPFIGLGIDVGGTKTALAVVCFPAGEVLLEKVISTLPVPVAEATLAAIALEATRLTRQAQQAGHAIAGVGVGLCELVGLSGQILSHNLLQWNQAQVESQLGHLGSVTIDADVRAAARAEALFGAGRPFRSFLYVTVGTGIACSLVVDQTPYLGARGATGTMASSPLSWTCEACGHLNSQTLEQIASGPALAQRLNQGQPAKVRSGEEVLAAALAGNTAAGLVIASAGRALGCTVALMVNVLDPEAVVVGGGLGLSEGPFWASFLESTRTHIWSEVHRDLPILRAAAGTRAGVIGAALAVWKAK
jgi:glucokinase